MVIFKKNIWLLFYLIVFIGMMLLAMAIYQKYDELLSETKNNQRYLTKISQNRLNSLFKEQEILHNVLGNEYLHNPNFNREIFTTVLKLNPLLVDIWIFSKEGELQLATLPNASFPNLLQNQNTQQWFQETLDAEKMVIGRAYLLKSINQWILPIRKSIIDDRGEITAVISTAINLTMLTKRWPEEDSYQNTVQAVLDNGAFRILRTNLKTADYRQYYDNPLAENALFGQPLLQLTARLKAEKTLNQAAFIQDIIPLTTGKTLYTLSYNERYGFWTSAEIPYRLIAEKLYQPCILYTFFYLLLLIIIFSLFNWIVKIENSKMDELNYKAEHDTLTGLPNRIFLNKQFHKLHPYKKAPFALLHINLDNFKNINNMFGHSYGDLLLIEVTKRIQQSLAPYKGLVTRYSGDEFVIVFESQDKEEIAEYATFLLKRIALPYLIDHNILKISSSIGIARFPDDAKHIEALLSYAEHSMSIAKKNKNHHLFFSKAVHYQLMRNIEIEQELHRAIMNDEISLVYQPQLDREQKLLGVEALVRWNSKKLGFIGPDIFIPIAEETGLMPKLGLYIIHKALKEIAALKKRQELAFKLSINVSVRQFMQIDFIEKLMQACTYYSTDKSEITIEITETLFIESLETLLPLFHKIKASSISLSLDDFGTGYSSLSMLRKIPVDELKIDKSFVDNIATNRTDRAMVKNIISMGKELGMTVLAEGVETDEQVEILQQADCDIFQGYYFSKPLAINDLAHFAKNHQS